MLLIFIEGKPGRGDTGRETFMWERNTSQLPLACVPNGTKPTQPRHVPWSGIKPMTFWFSNQRGHTGQDWIQCSILMKQVSVMNVCLEKPTSQRQENCCQNLRLLKTIQLWCSCQCWTENGEPHHPYLCYNFLISDQTPSTTLQQLVSFTLSSPLPKQTFSLFQNKMPYLLS